MELALLVYGISLLEGITNICVATAIISIIGVVFSLMICIGEELESKAAKYYYKILRRCIIVLALSLVVATAVPSEKTAYMMLGAYATQKVAEDPKVQQLSGKVLTIVEQKLDELIKPVK